MAVTVHIQHGESPLSLTVDAPRVVIGRSKSCEIQLVDPTVSARHASLRLDQGRPVVIDEGSSNGVLVEGVRIPSRTPWPIDDGHQLRVGRVWLDVRIEAAPPEASGGLSPARRARAVALELLAKQLDDVGEAADAWIEVVDGPDRGARLELADGDYTLGRARDADLQLADASLSRHHAIVWLEAGEWRVRDGGSRCGCELAGAPLDGAGRTWHDGEALSMGQSRLVLHAPLDEALEDAFAAADLRMKPEERNAAPPREREVPAPPPVETEVEETPIRELDLPAMVERVLAEPRGRALGAIDVLVALVAIGVLCVSVAGLWWVLYG